MTPTRYVTGFHLSTDDVPVSLNPTPSDAEMEDPERFRIYRLCDGELEIVATCGTPEAVGVALVTLAREGEFDKCPIGVMDRPAGQKTGTWLVRPWLPFPTPKNASDAGRTLAKARKTTTHLP